jgi:DNA-directed RNA polymerase subunit RPC12/RpoP
MKTMICPNCSNEIEFLNFFRAPTPWHIKCKHCGSKLMVEKHRGTAIILAIAYGILLGFCGVGVGILLFARIHLLTVIVIVIAGAFIGEVLYYSFLKRHGVGLQIRKKQPPSY